MRAFLLTALALLCSCGGSSQPSLSRKPLLVAAASSLGDVLPPLLDEFQRQNQVTVRAVLSSSGELARQLRAGAPFDLIFLAADAPMDALAQAGLVDAAHRRELAGNRLVLAVRSSAAPSPPPADLADAWRLLQGRRVAIGAPGVAAGDYARRWLQSARLAEGGGVTLQQHEHARAVLAAVEGGEADAGFVYATDLVGRRGMQALLTATPDETGPVRCPAAVTAQTEQPELARKLLEFLEQQRPAFLEAGFLQPDQ